MSLIQPTFFCPFPSGLNPHAATIERNLIAWTRHFRLLGSERAYQRLHRIQYGHLIALAYPHAPLVEAQIVADWTCWLFVLDDHCDETGLGKCPGELARVHTQLLNALRGEPVAEADGLMVRALQDLRGRMLAQRDAAWLARFTATIEAYFAANIWEAVNRVEGRTPDVATYLRKRPFAGALYSYFPLIEMTEHLHLPDAVREHPDVRRLVDMVNNIVCWTNDVLSFAKEHEHGDVHNLVAVLHHEQGMGYQEAMDQAAAMSNAETRAFLALEASLPSFGAADADVRSYLRGMHYWLRANLEWSVVTDRYRPGTAT